MDEKFIPYILYESAMSRAERHARRLVIIIIMTIILLFMSNGIWLYNWFNYDFVSDSSETVTLDANDGNANYVIDSGDIINGENKGNKENESNQD